MNTVYRDLIRSRAQAAIDGARAVTGIGHQGLKGQLREIVIRDLLRPLFPADIGLGTGEIITASDQRSRQQDVVVFDKSIVPPILLEGTTGVFPIESVLYSIEIKSTLTVAELRSSLGNATELDTLRYLPGEYGEDDRPKQPEGQALIPAILAFDTDLTEKGKTELERFEETWAHATKEPPLRMLCVVGRGYWSWRPKDGWAIWPTTYPLEEVVASIAVIMNSYKLLAQSRKAPRLGLYLM